VNTVMNHQVPQNVGKFLIRWTTGGFLMTQLHGVSLFSCVISQWPYCTRHLSNLFIFISKSLVFASVIVYPK
jgi:hypothetical protein